MKNKTIITVVTILLIALCGFLWFGIFNKPSNADTTGHGGLQLGIPKEDKEDSDKIEDSQKKEDPSTNESKTDSASQQSNDGSDTNTEPSNEGNDVPEGGQVVDNGDGSVDVIINDDEDTFGI